MPAESASAFKLFIASSRIGNHLHSFVEERTSLCAPIISFHLIGIWIAGLKTLLQSLEWYRPGRIVELWAEGNVPIIEEAVLGLISDDRSRRIITLRAMTKPKTILVAIDPEIGVPSL